MIIYTFGIVNIGNVTLNVCNYIIFSNVSRVLQLEGSFYV